MVYTLSYWQAKSGQDTDRIIAQILDYWPFSKAAAAAKAKYVNHFYGRAFS